MATEIGGGKDPGMGEVKNIERILKEDELKGLDISEHGMEAYWGFRYSRQGSVFFLPRNAIIKGGTI